MHDDRVIMLIDWQEAPLGYSVPCMHHIYACMIELCDTIDTTRYHDTKQYRSTSSFGIVGIDYAI